MATSQPQQGGANAPSQQQQQGSAPQQPQQQQGKPVFKDWASI